MERSVFLSVIKYDNGFEKMLREIAREQRVGQWNRLSTDALIEFMQVQRCIDNFNRCRATLLFDGEFLHWHDDSACQGSPERKWKAYSGREGYWSAVFQKLRDIGPVPEGEYVVRQDRFQRWEDLSMIQKVACIFRRGEWPGCTIAWGTERVDLEPMSHTNTWGRSGCTIHGGTVPGSAGCIDLTGSMSSFAHEFRKYVRDMRLTVRYKPLPAGKGYHGSTLKP